MYLQITNPAADCYIERNVFRNSAGIVAAALLSNRIYIRNNAFDRWGRARERVAAVEVWWGSQVHVQYNSFLSTDRVALALSGAGEGMIATQNFWNSLDEAKIQSMILDKNDDLHLEGYIEYKPFLTDPHPHTPVLPAP